MSAYSFSQSPEALKAAARKLDQDPDLRSANWSLTVMDANSGALIYAHQPHRSLSTASTMKALTTATALAVLGADYQFSTSLQYDGELEDGVLKGNLYILGSGDPSLGSSRFGESFGLNRLMQDWVKAIQALGITEIRGKVIGDARIYSSQITPGEWPWEDMGNYYGAGATGLNIHENYYRLDFKSGATGSQSQILRTEPVIPGLDFVNEVKSGPAGSGDNAYIFGSPYTFLRYVRGTIPPGRSMFSIKGSIPDPPLYCAQRLEEEIIKCGIPVFGPASTMRREKLAGNDRDWSRKKFHSHLSPPLSTIVYHTNMKSVNVFAEALALHIAVKQGKDGTTAEATEAMEDYWKSQGIDIRGMKLRDGSGLSPLNVLSTYQLSQMLCKVHQSVYAKSFKASLPVAGESGSLKSMFKGTAAESRLRAKSGFISGVRSYTGYVERKDGKLLAFTFIVNHYSCSAGQMRRKMLPLMTKLAE